MKHFFKRLPKCLEGRCSASSVHRTPSFSCASHTVNPNLVRIIVPHIHTPIPGFLFPFLHLCLEKETIKVKPYLNLCLYSALVSETLSVVHITEDGMSMIKPREITKTHVVVDTPHLSAFGIVWDVLGRFMNFTSKPVSGQVLLFLRPAYRGRNLILSVLLLPSNVPIQEVKPLFPTSSFRSIFFASISHKRSQPQLTISACCKVTNNYCLLAVIVMF